MNTAIFTLIAYLIGSISFAVVVSWGFGLSDPRTYGSKNPGATNVLRSGNKAAAILTLIGDAAKGWLAVWLAQLYGPQFGVTDSGVAWVALAVFLGHLFPIFFKFIGGKGVATAAGILIAIHWSLGLGVLATWIIIAAFFRYSSLAALIASIFAPVWYVMLFGTGPYLLAVFAMSGLLIWRHRVNIGNLMAGKESRIGSKSGGKADDKGGFKADSKVGDKAKPAGKEKPRNKN
jgi:acyl phosphate:glycerol-3-phosphate acyltransferase